MDNALYERAVAYILMMPKTERQVRLWLRRKKVDETTADEIIERLRDNNFIDDENYARLFVEAKRNKMGAGVIKNKLRTGGVKYDIITAAVADVGDQHELALATAEKYLRGKPHTPEIKSKLFRYLLAKGFEFEEVEEVSNECWNRHSGG